MLQREKGVEKEEKKAWCGSDPFDHIYQKLKKAFKKEIPTSSSHTPVKWWRSLSPRWGRRRRADSRCAACWSRGPDSWWDPWSSRAWSGVDWASLIPCYTHSLCTCTERRKHLLSRCSFQCQMLHFVFRYVYMIRMMLLLPFPLTLSWFSTKTLTREGGLVRCSNKEW